MKELSIELGENSYQVIIAKKFHSIVDYVTKRGHAVVITDRNVSQYHLDALVNELETVYDKVYSYIIAPGENSKNYKVLCEIYDFLIQKQINRDDVIFSLGGGVVGDVVGFVAATYMRGISFINVPTSLLAQNDSSIGGKTAINYGNTKNVIGAFYQPKLVYTNTEVLKTLPLNEIKNGLVEIIVHAIIKDEKLFEYIEQNLNEIFELKQEYLEQLCYWNCKIKGSVVQNDELDKGERAILNFGHTFGHAIESTYNYQYSHGQCIALGIIGACFLALSRNLIPTTVLDRIGGLLERLDILQDISDCNVDTVLECMRHDKKSVSGDFYFILPLAIGHVEKYKIEDCQSVENAFHSMVEYVSNKCQTVCEERN